MALVHDLAEVVVGDITPHDQVASEEKDRWEREAFGELVRGLPGSEELKAYHRGYQELSTPEARFVKVCDKLDMALQARRYQDTQGLDLLEFIDDALKVMDQDLHRRLADGPARLTAI